MRFVAATHNKHKLEEFRAITELFGFELVTKEDVGLGDLDPEETGTTLEENSLIKARAICRAGGYPAIADDTGLMVDALNGAPGIYSARYGGEDGNDVLNRARLLKELAGVPPERRTAHFASVITAVWPDGRVLQARGEVHGHILEEERGDHGFGYDSLFCPDGYEEPFAVLPAELKNRISHRANALREFRTQLERLTREHEL